jgi:hypothetical protein
MLSHAKFQERAQSCCGGKSQAKGARRAKKKLLKQISCLSRITKTLTQMRKAQSAPDQFAPAMDHMPTINQTGGPQRLQNLDFNCEYRIDATEATAGYMVIWQESPVS